MLAEKEAAHRPQDISSLSCPSDVGRQNWELKIMELKKIMGVVAERYSEEHALYIYPNGICGIEDSSGQCEADFGSLEGLYAWVKDPDYFQKVKWRDR